ncbi:MAG: histidine phosphatase family protein [Actinomycetota bacterium]|nr:histidine phosphatase family protein [Actinomycetota bacterium]
MARLLLIRHGETEWSRTRRHTGRTDISLEPAGEAAARALGPLLADEEIAVVLSSPLARAWRTAELAGLGDRAQRDDDLVEWDYGEYEGRATAEIRLERPGWDVWRDGCPGGEAVEAVGARADRAIARAEAAAGEDGTAALFAHGHLLRILGARWIGLDASAGGRLALSTAALCELGHERERRVLWRWNDTRHLGEP